MEVFLPECFHNCERQAFITQIERSIALDSWRQVGFSYQPIPVNAAIDDIMTCRVPARTLFVTMGKAVITISAILVIGSQIDFGFLASHRHKLSSATLAASLVLLAMQTSLIAGLRLKLILKALGQDRRLGETFQVALSGFFFEQVAFGFVGGDAMRLWLLNRADIPLRKALQVIVIDRCLGSVGLLLLALVGLPGLVGLLTGYDWRIIVAGAGIAVPFAGAAAGLLLVYMAKRFRLPFAAEILALAAAVVHKPEVRRCLLSAFALATATHFVNVFIFFLIGRDLAMGLGFGHWFLVAPPALLISMLPISAGGWGIREASFVFGLASFGIPPEEAIIPPIIFGLGVLMVTLPGGIIWLANRKLASSNADESAIIRGSDSADGAPPAVAAASSCAGERQSGHRQQLVRLG